MQQSQTDEVAVATNRYTLICGADLQLQDLAVRLAHLVAQEVIRALGARAPAAANALLTKDELATAWRVSAATIDRMVRRGMPVERVTGDAPRFDLTACNDWRRDQPAAVAPASGEKSPVDMTGVRRVTRSGGR